ncbi:efflux RND transporter periplasmic adaptor subunit [Paenibacillus aquistagni]|uniref:efflux RND transporter periplasmic adaptor subunit n=1 Tax=Paenibacillus aquistagni TaxID=1852522 RepID=UPI00216609C2|nr:efflux RND transporter periplasmic adaptor subunit [Paenibacillus aquistagni]
MQSVSHAMSGRKRTIRLLFGLFIGLLIGFTLLSNTIVSLTLPKVSLITTSNGELVHTFRGSGTVKWREEAVLTGSAGGKVQEVRVKEGEQVKKGEVLVVYEQKAIKQLIEDEQAALDKMNVSLNEFQLNYIEARQSGDVKSIASAESALKLSEININVQEGKIQKLKTNMSESSVLTAPFDGIVTKVNVVEGFDVTEGKPEVTVANKTSGFGLELRVPYDAAVHLEVGAKLQVKLIGSNTRQVEGSIAEIKDAEYIGPPDGMESTGTHIEMKRLLITIQDKSLQGKEKAEVELTRTTDETILVPTKAIRDEGDQKYVFGIEERKGPLGNEFYVVKLKIKVVDSNETQSAVSEGLFGSQQIIVESSVPLQEGDRIRVH